MCSDLSLRRLTRSSGYIVARLVVKKRGELVFRQGDEGHAFYVVAYGMVGVIEEQHPGIFEWPERLQNERCLSRCATVPNRSAKEFEKMECVALLYKGDGFGELAILHNQPR